MEIKTPRARGFISYNNIKSNEYNLSFNLYVENKGSRELINIVKLNQEIKNTVNKINKIRAGIDEAIQEVEQYLNNI